MLEVEDVRLRIGGKRDREQVRSNKDASEVRERDLSDLSDLQVCSFLRFVNFRDLKKNVSWMDRRTDRPSYRDVWTHLRIMFLHHSVILSSFCVSFCPRRGL